MKYVVYDYQIFLQQEYGGISRYFYELAQRIDHIDGYCARIFAPLHANGYLASGRIPSHGIRVRKIPKVWKAYQVLDTLASRLYFGLRRPSIVHETYYSGRRVAPAASHTVVTVYDMIHEKLPHLFADDRKTTALKRIAVERADQVICISEHTRRDLIELFGVRPDKTVTVPLAFGLDTTPGVTLAPGLSIGSPYLLYVGSRDFHKNWRGLVTAYGASALLRDHCKLVAFGGPPPSQAEFDLIDRCGVGRDRILWERGNDDKLAALYRGAAAFVYPSLYEGFGIPPLEAMSFDCPVVCSNTSSIPEVVGDAAATFDPGDVEQIRTAIEAVVSSRSMSAALVARGRDRIRLFSWDRCAGETAAVYSNMLA